MTATVEMRSSLKQRFPTSNNHKLNTIVDIPPDYSKKHSIWRSYNMKRMVIQLILFSITVISIAVYAFMPNNSQMIHDKQSLLYSSNSSVFILLSPELILNKQIIDHKNIINIPLIYKQNIFTDAVINHKNRKHNAFVFLLQSNSHDSHQILNEFCSTLLSISSLKLSMIYDDWKSVSKIVFIPSNVKLPFNMNSFVDIKIIHYDIQQYSWTDLFQLSLKKLKDLNFQTVIYLHSHVFVLQNILPLFDILSNINVGNESIIIGGVWSLNIHSHPCLMCSAFAVNVNRILNAMLKMEFNGVFCDPNSVEFNGQRIIPAINIYKEMERKAMMFGIISLPWWYSITDFQYEKYFSKSILNGIGNEMNIYSRLSSKTMIADPVTILQLMQKLPFFKESKGEQFTPFPFMVRIDNVSDYKQKDKEINDELNLNWKIIIQKTIQKCRKH